MAPFAGWDMPIQYVGIIAEHMHTRTEASLFDICHMGEFLLVGAGAKDALAKVVTHNLETLLPGKCRYGFLLQEDGCVRDDLIVYCLGRDEYMLVVNGACTASDFAWIAGQLPASLSLDNISDATAKIDLQRPPRPFEVLHTVLGDGIPLPQVFQLRPHHVRRRAAHRQPHGLHGRVGLRILSAHGQGPSPCGNA